VVDQPNPVSETDITTVRESVQDGTILGMNTNFGARGTFSSTQVMIAMPTSVIR